MKREGRCASLCPRIPDSRGARLPVLTGPARNESEDRSSALATYTTVMLKFSLTL